MSFVDELMADFDEELEEDLKDVDETHSSIPDGEAMSGEIRSAGNGGIASNGADYSLQELGLSSAEAHSFDKLIRNLTPILERIRTDVPPRDTAGINVESHPSYQLLVDANNYSVDIDNEVLILHKHIKDMYSKRYDELHKLVPYPADYARAVKILGNDIEGNKEKLKSFLPHHTVLVVTMSAYSNQGQLLTSDEVEQVNKVCDLLIKLDDAKNGITRYVSRTLPAFAPNVTKIISSHIAAQIMGFVGGLSGLSSTRSANLPAVGNKRQVATGYGQTALQRKGFLYYCDLVQELPPDLQQKAMRTISARLVLAARMDLAHASPDGSQGIEWRKELEEKMQKLMEPPDVTNTKALPLPDQKKVKRRGGRRYRKMKEAFGDTELQRAQNKMGFNEQQTEYGDDEDEVVSRSALKSGGLLAVRASTANRAKLSKKNQARLDKVKEKHQNILFGENSDEIIISKSAAAEVSQTPAKPENKWFSSVTSMKRVSDSSTVNGSVNKKQKTEDSL